MEESRPRPFEHMHFLKKDSHYLADMDHHLTTSDAAFDAAFGGQAAGHN